jgi:hypothetical protein
MHRRDLDRLDPTQAYWVPAVVSPERDWSGARGSRRGARYLVDPDTLRASRDLFGPFTSRADCLEWILRNRAALNLSLPGAAVRAVQLDRWLLGLE